MNISTQIENVIKLQLPVDEFVVVSSGSLAVRGIREAKDIDIIVTKALWSKLIKIHPVGINDWGIEHIILEHDIEILNPSQSIFGNSKIVPVDELFSQADIFHSIKFMNLDHLKKIKYKLGRDIDMHDIMLIDRYTKQRSTL